MHSFTVSVLAYSYYLACTVLMINSTLWFQDRPLNHTFLPVHSPHLTQVLNLYNVMLFSRTLHWPHMDLGETKRAISSVEPDSNHYSQRYLSVCASSACGSTSTSWAKTEKREDAKRLIRVPRPKRHCEATVSLREREQRLTLSWGRDLQLRSSSAVF